MFRRRLHFPHLTSRQGFALVAVLGLTTLAMILVLALLSVSDTSLKSESLDWEQTRARVTADTAVALALGQLKSATSGQFSDGTPRPWTSQPGAIRTYHMDGSLATLHKLYTAADMQAESTASITNDLPGNWQDHPDQFADLNAPLSGSNGQLQFPIVDPRAKTGDPLTGVEGFDYTTTHGAVGPEQGSDAQRLPMPVRWIYQRRDGTLAVPDSQGNLSPAETPDKPNPVIARFAYWVDDESCKVNINTAGEGAFWDVPRADTEQERNLAKSQPTTREYHRQPGHPAGVCLSSVLLPGRRLYPTGFVPEMMSTGTSMMPMALEDARDLWRMGRLAMAELGNDTSWAGTVRPDWAELWGSTPRPIMRQARYANASEAVFDNANPSDFPGLANSANGRQRRLQPLLQNHPEIIDRLERSAFFLTAHSSAPEVTLYGTPRVAMWPVHANTLLNTSGPNGGDAAQKDTVYDHKVALTARLKGRHYLVLRSEPGQGGNDLEVHAAGSNKTLQTYLTRLTDKPVPGYLRPSHGYSSFADKYGDDREAFLLEMLDYVRASNFADGHLSKNMQFSILCPGVEHKGFGQIAPLQQRVTGSKAATSNHVQGLGRMMTISEVALIIVCRAEVDANKVIRGQPSSTNKDKLKEPGDREFDIGILVEGFVPGQSWADYRPYVSIGLVGGAPGAAPTPKTELPKMKLNTKDVVRGSTMMDSADLPPSQWLGAGGSLGVRSLHDGAILFKPIVLTASESSFTEPLHFEGGSKDAMQLKLAVYDSPGSALGGSSAATDLVQVIPLMLPDITPQNGGTGIPLPRLPKDTTKFALEERLKKAAKDGSDLISSADIVQSLAPIHGDYRLTATQRWAESRDGTTSTPTYVPHTMWGKQAQAHTLRDHALPAGTGTRGYIHDLAYASPSRPDMPASLVEASANAESLIRLWKSGNWTEYKLSEAIDSQRLDKGDRGPALPEITGDFDNGLGNLPDGPYINRADDGHWAAAKDPEKVPYFDNVSQTGASTPPVSLSTFSAQRLLPSPVMFGSLPTGTRAQVPWQTLLFRPQANHFGAKTPPDHLLLDLFWSPVIEPEPISQAFETAGKINLNHMMVPFSHITRATALHAAMKAEAMMAIPDSAAATYKNDEQPDDRFRHFIDASATLKLWQTNVFDNGKVFLTASEICEQPLIPECLIAPGEQPSNARIESYWQRHRLTGDNSKERPYAHLYPRLTTRSNTFRVHFIAQSLKKARSTDPDTFDSTKDQVTATLRGSCLLKRELNVDDPTIPDYMAPPPPGSTAVVKPLDAFYRWRREAMKMVQ